MYSYHKSLKYIFTQWDLNMRQRRLTRGVPGSSSPVLLEWDEETRRGLCSTMSHMSAG